LGYGDILYLFNLTLYLRHGGTLCLVTLALDVSICISFQVDLMPFMFNLS